MNARFLAIGCMLLLAAPLSLAHSPAGTPKNFCEDSTDVAAHDYAPPATGSAVFLLQDGNLAGDCNFDGTPADFDGHLEFALGGAWLLAESGDGVSDGSVACYGAAADHTQFGPFLTVDAALGATVSYRIEADTVNLVPPTDPTAPDCGDFTTDEGADCVGVCSVTFTAGIDGAYIVYVTGTQGHVCSPTPACDNGALLGGSLYAAPATVVVRSGEVTQLDVGALVCTPDLFGVGGACLRWTSNGNAVELNDLAGEVAYQVCIDNSGDGVCTPEQGGPCADQIFFSHSDNGGFDNPLGPLPISFASGCDTVPGFNGFPGYVVFLCGGLHADNSGPHPHLSAGGTAKVTTGGEGNSGNFCGGPQVLGKPYFVIG